MKHFPHGPVHCELFLLATPLRGGGQPSRRLTEAEGHTAPGEGLIWTQDRFSPTSILLTPHQAGPRPVLSSLEDSSQTWEFSADLGQGDSSSRGLCKRGRMAEMLALFLCCGLSAYQWASGQRRGNKGKGPTLTSNISSLRAAVLCPTDRLALKCWVFFFFQILQNGISMLKPICCIL